MKILGLTGSIGMGKSEAARMLKAMGVPVFEADKAVHLLLGEGGAGVAEVQRLFPDCVVGGLVDRARLGAKIFSDVHMKRQLEAILHPLVRLQEKKFLAAQRRKGKRIVAVDIPLLFETGAGERCDAVMVVTAPPMLQRQRVLKRAGMTEEKFHAILAAQMPDIQKRAQADFLIHTGLGKQVAMWQIRRALKTLLLESHVRPRNRPRYRNHRA